MEQKEIKKTRGEASSLRTKPGLKDNPVVSYVTWLNPLKELLDYQSVVLRTALSTETLFADQEEPKNVGREVLENSGSTDLLRRRGIDPEVFLEMVTRKHSAIVDAREELRRSNVPNYLEALDHIVDEAHLKFRAELGEMCQNPEDLNALDNQITRMLTSPKSSSLLFQSIFVFSFSLFENFLADTTRSLLSSRDELLGDRSEKFSWEEIRSPNAVSKLREQMVEKSVGELMRRSMDGWLGWYTKKTKLQLNSGLVESCMDLYQLRNRFIHESGPNYLYREAANRALVQKATDQLAILAFLITESSVRSLKNEYVTRVFLTGLSVLEVRQIDEKRWSVAEQMCKKGMEMLQGSEQAEIHRVNLWLTLLRSGNESDVINQVSAWDVSALPPVFELAKRVLLDDYPSAIQLARKLHSAGQLSRSQWGEWPLFDQIRKEQEL